MFKIDGISLTICSENSQFFFWTFRGSWKTFKSVELLAINMVKFRKNGISQYDGILEVIYA